MIAAFLLWNVKGEGSRRQKENPSRIHFPDVTFIVDGKKRNG
jgi:hypothetical protein